MATYVVSVPAGSQSLVQAVTPQTSICYGPQVLGGTALLESSPTPNGPWTTVQSVTAAASFRPALNSYVRLTATTQAGSMALSDMTGSISPLTTSTLISSSIPFASPSSAAAQTIFSFRIPPQYLPQNFKLIMEFTLNLTNSANVKTVNVLMNGASGTNIGSYACTSFATFNGMAVAFAFDGANLKGSLGAAAAAGYGGSTTAFPSLARDYINNETEFVVSITKATAAETAECVSFSARLLT